MYHTYSDEPSEYHDTLMTFGGSLGPLGKFGLLITQGHNIQRFCFYACHPAEICRLRLGVSHLLLLFTTVTCNYSRIYNSVLQKFTEKKKQDGEMHRKAKSLYIIVTLKILKEIRSNGQARYQDIESQKIEFFTRAEWY